MANQSGISVCLVTNPSKKPAIIKNGMVLIKIFNPFQMQPMNSDEDGLVFQEL